MYPITADAALNDWFAVAFGVTTGASNWTFSTEWAEILIVRSGAGEIDAEIVDPEPTFAAFGHDTVTDLVTTNTSNSIAPTCRFDVNHGRGLVNFECGGFGAHGNHFHGLWNWHLGDSNFRPDFDADVWVRGPASWDD